MAKPENPYKLPSLDGWRAVSIGLVLLGHCVYAQGVPATWRDWLGKHNTGGSGVLFFFVISGFLITYLLLQEQGRTGNISLKHFYLRRAFRILPVYFVYLLVVALTDYRQPSGCWLANLTFTTNFHIPPFATAHLWSLAVEEQFYLLWPCLLVWGFSRGQRPENFLGWLGIPLVVAPLVRLLECKHWYPDTFYFLFQWGSFFARCDALAVGCLAAVWLACRREAVVVFCSQKFPLKLGLAIALILCPTVFRIIHVPARVQAAAGDSLLASGFCLLLLLSVLLPTRRWFCWLNWKWVSHIGILSYSIYIWQQMFCGTGETVFGVKDAWWTNFPVWLITTLLAAHASYYLLEKPLLGLRAKFREA